MIRLPKTWNIHPNGRREIVAWREFANLAALIKWLRDQTAYLDWLYEQLAGHAAEARRPKAEERPAKVLDVKQWRDGRMAAAGDAE